VLNFEDECATRKETMKFDMESETAALFVVVAVAVVAFAILGVAVFLSAVWH